MIDGIVLDINKIASIQPNYTRERDANLVTNPGLLAFLFIGFIWIERRIIQIFTNFGRNIKQNLIFLKLFILSSIRFYDKETRTERLLTDKLAAVLIRTMRQREEFTC